MARHLKRGMDASGRIGTTFDDFLKEEGIYETVTATARKRVIARRSARLGRKQKPVTDATRNRGGQRAS
jgi:hypothetical protein